MKRSIYFSVAMIGLLGLGTAQAQHVVPGKICSSGVAVTPATSGKVISLFPPTSDIMGKCYTLVAQGGVNAVIVSPEGDTMTPKEVWDRFGGYSVARATAKR